MRVNVENKNKSTGLLVSGLLIAGIISGCASTSQSIYSSKPNSAEDNVVKQISPTQYDGEKVSLQFLRTQTQTVLNPLTQVGCSAKLDEPTDDNLSIHITNQPCDRVLDALAFSQDLSYKQTNGKTIVTQSQSLPLNPADYNFVRVEGVEQLSTIKDDELLSFHFEDVKLSVLIDVLSMYNELNMVVNDEVNPKINFQIIGASWQNTLFNLLAENDLALYHNGDILVVKPSS